MTVATSPEDLMTTFPPDLVPAPPRASLRVPVKLPVELPVAADRHAPLPLTGQIAAQLREALAAGRLAAGERLPSTRALASRGLLPANRRDSTGEIVGRVNDFAG